MSYKLLFNTGVRPSAGSAMMPFQIWHNGTKHIEFWVEHRPSSGAKFAFASPYDNVPNTDDMERIRIVDGGLSSEWAYFELPKNSYVLNGTMKEAGAIGESIKFSKTTLSKSALKAMDEIRESLYKQGYEHILFKGVMENGKDIDMYEALELD